MRKREVQRRIRTCCRRALAETYSATLTKIYPYMIPSPDLLGGQQFGKRKDHQTFNGTLQMARTVLRICAFVQKEHLHLGSASKCKLWTTGCLQYALLN